MSRTIIVARDQHDALEECRRRGLPPRSIDVVLVTRDQHTRGLAITDDDEVVIDDRTPAALLRALEVCKMRGGAE